MITMKGCILMFRETSCVIGSQSRKSQIASSSLLISRWNGTTKPTLTRKSKVSNGENTEWSLCECGFRHYIIQPPRRNNVKSRHMKKHTRNIKGLSKRDLSMIIMLQSLIVSGSSLSSFSASLEVVVLNMSLTSDKQFVSLENFSWGFSFLG